MDTNDTYTLRPLTLIKKREDNPPTPSSSNPHKPLSQSSRDQVHRLLTQEYERQAICQVIRPVILKLKIIQLKASDDYNSSYQLLTDILKVMKLTNSQINQFLFSMLLKHTSQGISQNDPNKSSQKVSILIHKVTLNLHQRLRTLLEEPAIDILNPYCEKRLKFLNMLSWFNYYQEMRHDVTTNGCVGWQGIRMEYRGGEEEEEEEAATSTNSSLGPIRGFMCHRRANYIRITEPIHKFSSNCIVIRFNHWKFLTPPNITVSEWERFMFNWFLQSTPQNQPPTKMKTGFLDYNQNNCTKEEEFYQLQKLMILDETMTKDRINRFLQDLKHISNISIEAIDDISQLDDLNSTIKAYKYFPQSCDSIEQYEDYLFICWYKKFNLTIEQFQKLENIIKLLTTKIAWNDPSSKYPIMRFPKFYNFLLANGVEFTVNNQLLNLTRNLETIDLLEEPDPDILDFYKSVFLHNMIFNEILEDEFNSLIIDKLITMRDEINQALTQTISCYLEVNYSQLLSSSISKDQKSTDQRFQRYYETNIKDSLISRTIKSKLYEAMLNCKGFHSKISFQSPHLQQCHTDYHKIMDFFYGVYYPSLNWIYRDLGRVSSSPRVKGCEG